MRSGGHSGLDTLTNVSTCLYFSQTAHTCRHTHTKDNPKFRERNINIVFHKRALGFVDNAKKN